MKKFEQKMLEKMTPEQRKDFEEFAKTCDLAGIDDKLEALMKWFCGSTLRFVSEVKEREDKSVDKKLFRSYVNLNIANCIAMLSDVSDYYLADDDAPSKEKRLTKEEVTEIINSVIPAETLKATTSMVACMSEVMKSQYSNIMSKIDEAYGHKESGE